MGRLEQIDGGRGVRLGTRLLVGRAPGCALRLAAPEVSAEHAVLAWSEGRWTLRDLGSSNGTKVGDRTLAPGRSEPLAEGDVLQFGAQSQRFRLVSAAPPALFAEELESGAVHEAEGELLVLPGPERPELTVFRGDGGRFMLEREGDVGPAEDGALVLAGGRRFRLHLPGVVESTRQFRAAPLTLPTARFVFGVSGDEEHVELAVVQGSRRVEVPARAHLYVLLTLARRRLLDAEAGEHPETAHGWTWTEDLLRMLAMDENALNVAIYRARRQLAELGLEGAAGIVERRPQTRELRFGSGEVSVRRI